MEESSTNNIIAYLKSQSRNKIVFYRTDIPQIKAVDIGKVLTRAIYNFKDENKLSQKVTDEINKILNDSITEHNTYGKILAIENIGILMEPELKQDFVRILENFSINNVFFLKVTGEIDDNHIYFQTKEKGIKINIKHLSYILL